MKITEELAAALAPIVRERELLLEALEALKVNVFREAAPLGRKKTSRAPGALYRWVQAEDASLAKVKRANTLKNHIETALPSLDALSGVLKDTP